MDWLEDQIEAVRRSGGSSLDLSGRSLETLPESLGSLTGLTRLILVNNQLSALPAWLGNLTALTRLGLGGNRLTVLPGWLGNLTALTWLGLSGNRLSALPESLGNLTALTWLDLANNQLSVLPEWLGNATALTRLDLSGNQLSALPESLANLTTLTRLDLAGNHLTVLPEWLSNPTGREHPVNASLQAWIDGTSTTVAGAADLDAILDRVPPSGLSLISEDGVRTLHIILDRDRSGLVWEDEADIMMSWGPAPPGAPPGQTAGGTVEPWDDPWFTDEPEGVTEELARQAGQEFLRTGRRPTNVQWVDKP
jgi:Leucine rich repeat/Immunity protein Imm1